MRGRRKGTPAPVQAFLLFRWRRATDSEHLVASYATLAEAVAACEQLNQRILAAGGSPWDTDLAYVMRGSIKAPKLARALEPDKVLRRPVGDGGDTWVTENEELNDER